MTEPVDWKTLLGEVILAKSQLDELDPEHVEPYTLPRSPASDDDIAAVGAHLGEGLPEQYRQFLAHADGWPSFYFRADLFGTAELRGAGAATVAAELLSAYEREGAFEDLGFAAADVIPICAGPGMRVLFILVRAGHPNAGMVSWIDGEEVDRYHDFTEFIASMRDYTLRQADKLREQMKAD